MVVNIGKMNADISLIASVFRNVQLGEWGRLRLKKFRRKQSNASKLKENRID